MVSSTSQLANALRGALYPASSPTPDVFDDGSAHGLPSIYDVTGFATASMGLAAAELVSLAGTADSDAVTVSRELASRWFGFTIRPAGWELPPTWDAIAGVYETRDRWIRLHTNAPHHRLAALRVLDCAADRDEVSRRVSRWSAVELEQAIVDAGGCAAVMYSRDEWAAHPQGAAVAREPLIGWNAVAGPVPAPRKPGNSPLQGIRILDCTRVLAGPVCTRFLAGFGAEVLRIDPPDWQEGVVEPEVTLGKRLSTLDLRSDRDRERFCTLLREADVLVHGYRSDALAGIGFDDATRRQLNPDQVDVALCAYGWTGPWAARRGFDSLVQMSAGLAHAGMSSAAAEAPVPLPVQALDQGTGYLMAAAVLRALRVRAESGVSLSARLSLARTAEFLAAANPDPAYPSMPEEDEAVLTSTIEETSWGPARRVRFPVIRGCPEPHWPYPARQLHADSPSWE